MRHFLGQDLPFMCNGATFLTFIEMVLFSVKFFLQAVSSGKYGALVSPMLSLSGTPTIQA